MEDEHDRRMLKIVFFLWSGPQENDRSAIVSLTEIPMYMSVYLTWTLNKKQSAVKGTKGSMAM